MRTWMTMGIAAIAAVWGMAGTAEAQRLNTGGNPNFGTRSIAPGFTPDPISVNVTSGGNLNVSGMSLGAGCTGYATPQPDFRFNLTGTSNFLRVFVEAAGDTTLIINDAHGTWHCADDTYGTNPGIDLTNAGPGQYDVWIGSYRSGEQIRGALKITELRNVQPGGGSAQPTPTPPPSSGGNSALDTHANPNFGTRSITPGFTPDPMNVNVTSGGNINAATANLGAGCVGYLTRAPDFRINLTANDNFLRIYATSNAGDVTLVVNSSNGSWVCNDDSNGGTNPSVDLRNVGAGQIDVWVGSYQSGVQARSVLHVTELEGNHP